MCDIGPARMALLPPAALRHPECAIALSKQGCDLAVTLPDTLDDDTRLCLGIKCLERWRWPWSPATPRRYLPAPRRPARWQETRQTGPGFCAQRVDTAPLRVKRFQDRVDMGAMLRR